MHNMKTIDGAAIREAAVRHGDALREAAVAYAASVMNPKDVKVIANTVITTTATLIHEQASVERSQTKSF
jgi:hypothetical protein